MIPAPWSSHKKKTMEKILSKSNEPFSSIDFAAFQRLYLKMNRGAGDRDRTGMVSLEGWGSTIELHPRGDLPE